MSEESWWLFLKTSTYLSFCFELDSILQKICEKPESIKDWNSVSKSLKRAKTACSKFQQFMQETGAEA
jgi:hypothetical protein